jgi:hypothetical protein
LIAKDDHEVAKFFVGSAGHETQLRASSTCQLNPITEADHESPLRNNLEARMPFITPMSNSPEQDDSRIKQAEKIASHPEQYKVCEGCGSIVVARAVTCPSCHAYRFDATAQRVVTQARHLALKNPASVLSSDLS